MESSPLRKKSLNLPNIPELSKQELLETDNKILASAISRLKYYIPMAKEFLNDEQVETVKKYVS